MINAMVLTNGAKGSNKRDISMQAFAFYACWTKRNERKKKTYNSNAISIQIVHY